MFTNVIAEIIWRYTMMGDVLSHDDVTAESAWNTHMYIIVLIILRNCNWDNKKWYLIYFPWEFLDELYPHETLSDGLSDGEDHVILGSLVWAQS